MNSHAMKEALQHVERMGTEQGDFLRNVAGEVTDLMSGLGVEKTGQAIWILTLLLAACIVEYKESADKDDCILDVVKMLTVAHMHEMRGETRN